MGGKFSSQVSQEDVIELQQKTHFDEMELMSLYEQFTRISNSQIRDDLIDQEEFREALGLTNSDYIVHRIFSVFDENGDGFINVKEFICGLSFMSKKATFEDKLKFVFRIYDLDRDGFIDKEELYNVFKASLDQTALSLTEEQMRSMIDSTFFEADLNHDGLISYDEFRLMVIKHPQMIDSMTLNKDLIALPK
ncbi:putative Calcineurin subunit B [Blattamonas nauphoetae]|uniref:Calcineurin subunit B n=1 Tax=Blattamonas nauphoetae TaxID=2049346 RepID=A0ABQ9YLZ9_9EUKA|nr:putative Calcineurin subunit B [Blattamonas nauphoetae]